MEWPAPFLQVKFVERCARRQLPVYCDDRPIGSAIDRMHDSQRDFERFAQQLFCSFEQLAREWNVVHACCFEPYRTVAGECSYIARCFVVVVGPCFLDGGHVEVFGRKAKNTRQVPAVHPVIFG